MAAPVPYPASIARPYGKFGDTHSEAGFALQVSTTDAGCRAATHPPPTPYTPRLPIRGKYEGHIRWYTRFRLPVRFAPYPRATAADSHNSGPVARITRSFCLRRLPHRDRKS